jgi:hypothetical protein|tara:strand:- start:520 stop:702 length:183 start_codon:yes stop_codon:yes gene_type:complete
MNNKLTTCIILALSIISTLFAQDPPPLPGAPNQGPIGGMVWLAIGGILLAVKMYSGNNKK